MFRAREFSVPPQTSNILELKIELKTTLVIVFTHAFPIYLSNSAHKSSGFFEEPKFDNPATP